MSSKLINAKLVIIGAGPAGLMAAITAANAGTKVIVIEQLPEAGTRLLATGGGHCNFTNTLDVDGFIRRFGAKSRFVAPALKAMDGNRLRIFFEELGVESHSPDGFHVFPVSGSAGSVRDALLQACKKMRVEIRFNSRVESLQTEGGHVTGLITAGAPESASRVILSAGGASYPNLGGGESGFNLARSAGHTIVTPCPALVPLVTRETWPTTLAGVTLTRVSINLAGKSEAPRGAEPGSLLFTHRGISGPAALDISGLVSSMLMTHEFVPVTLDLSPGKTIEALQKDIERWRAEHGAKTMLAMLGSVMPAALAKIFLNIADIPTDTLVARLSREQNRRLRQLIKNLPLTVSGTEGFAKAMATRGGVAVDEVNPKTLESKLIRGLFFAGEILDIDGPCGGFNLQWAFSSGRLAAMAACIRRQLQHRLGGK